MRYSCTAQVVSFSVQEKTQLLLKFIQKLHLVYLPFKLMDILKSRLLEKKTTQKSYSITPSLTAKILFTSKYLVSTF